jgi:hypothetical protein
LSCQSGLTNCSGTCTNTTFDPGNCGSCGNACVSGPNAVASCGGSTCSLTCVGLYGNCNGVASDGCEKNLASDTSNCGTCSNVCPTPANSSPACAAGVCGVTCNANYGNCDGNNTNGCEVNLLTDNSNCGSCGHACATGTCQSGTCASTAAQCVTGADATTGSPYVICSVTASDIWISANNAGSYYPAAICALYGYSTVAQWGGTCGSVCAYCQGATSCSSPGNETFDVGAYSGGSISDTVMWRCTR